LKIVLFVNNVGEAARWHWVDSGGAVRQLGDGVGGHNCKGIMRVDVLYMKVEL
jgi:hypothetical protein